MEARVSACWSIRSASLASSRPRVSGVVVLHVVSKALRAAATAMSTSFSVASWTEQMGFSVAGLIVSNVFPSTALTHSLLMNLEGLAVIAVAEMDELTGQLAAGMSFLHLGAGPPEPMT
jgi:hypothetical protein